MQVSRLDALMGYDLHILNHNYHAKRIADPAARIVVIGPEIEDQRVLFNEGLFESKPLPQKLKKSPHETVKKVLPFAREAERIYLWGVQDIVTNKLMQKIQDFSEVRVVPDNIEFFLRFAPPSKTITSTLLKAAVYRDFCSALTGRTRSHSGRFTFDLPKGTIIDDSLAFYNDVSFSFRTTKCAAPYSTFISQPYYNDLQIDEKKWAERVVNILRNFQAETGEVIRIKYHQRDQFAYKTIITEAGFREADTISHKCIGFFSTMLFEAALSGAQVRLILDEVRDFLGGDYTSFVDWFSKSLKIKTDPSECLNITPDNFRMMLPLDLRPEKGK